MQPQTLAEAEARVHEYIDAVVSGRVTVGKWERLAVERHRRDLLVGGERGLRFSEARARHILEFAVRFVRHTKGRWAGQPFVLEGWEAFLLWVMFGWERYDDETGAWSRRFREAYVSMARKNAKTFIAAVIGLYMFAADGEAGAEVHAVATKRDQARKCWSQAAQIVRRSPDKEFKRAIRTVDSTSRMTILADDCVFEALGRDKDSLDGGNTHCGIADELHAWKNREPWDVLKSSQGARAQPLMLGITTAGSRREGICWELDHYGQRILEGLIDDDAHFTFICRIDEGDDWADERVWRKANPNLGVSVSVQKLRDDCKSALNKPAYQNEFRRKHTNEWTEADTAWLGLQHWDKCAEIAPAESLHRAPCYVGLDVSSTHDMTALVAVFPPHDERETWAVEPHFWIPRDTIEKRVHTDRVPVDVWVEQGLVEATFGNVIDQDAVKMKLLNMRERYDIREVPYDPYQGWKLATELSKLGFEMVQFRQGFLSMSPAMKETEKLILQGALAHGGNPVLRWQFSNVSVAMDPAGNMKPDKARSADRIDGPVALMMAVGRASLQGGTPAQRPGVYMLG